MTDNKITANEKGQLSIFLAAIIIIIITMIAFVVNVGLFVKAKINLQNAVDSAAYAGASVQARQLTNIAYTNWEMRNNYKEWMFKYYVLGQLGLPKTKDFSGSASMDFYLRQFFNNPSDPEFKANEFDPFNIPSICIHFGSPHNICEIYDVPGLPRFETPGLPSIGEAHKVFLDSIVETKSKDCAVRSDLNFSTAMQWAYGTETNVFAGVPQVAASRIGAWPLSLELAFRMRNLEMIINRPPVASPLCGISDGSCLAFGEFEQQGASSTILSYMNERPAKAYMSAFRNLSGGSVKDGDDLLASSFKLTELVPTPYEAQIDTVSQFLIPTEASYPVENGTPVTTKHYLDLQAVPLNLVTFFTSFVPKTGSFAGVDSQAACGGSKTALPVPGFIIGFNKNPEVLTYYSVKGEARYMGMFYPFSDTSNGITLKAYAAAKPFGGRIGPKLFGFAEGGKSVVPRPDTKQFRSTSYISGLNTSSLGSFKAGFPIPLSTDFWVADAGGVVGGVPGTGVQVKYGIPNLIYDFENASDLSVQAEALGGFIQTIQRRPNYSTAPSERRGLYHKPQFRMMASNLPPLSTGTVLSAQDVDLAMEKSRRPTRYDVLNYLVPTQETAGENPEGLENLARITSVVGTGNGGSPIYRLFAPLFGAGTLYPELSTITAIVEKYIEVNKPSIQIYLESLRAVAVQIVADGPSGGTGNLYKEAAATIHDQTISLIVPPNCEKVPLATKFNQFFNGDVELCEIEPLKTRLVSYFNRKSSEGGGENGFNSFYDTTYYKPESFGVSNSQLSTGYAPGPRAGVAEDASSRTPTGSALTFKQKRNIYSTKFIPIEKIMNGGMYPFDEPSALMESAGMQQADDLADAKIKNLLIPNELSEFGQLHH
jgi:hypothetical protein